MDRNKKGQYIKGHFSLNFKDLLGKKFGRLTVTERSYPNTKLGDAMWLCKCECGKERIVVGNSLRRGLTKSCGCLNVEVASKSNKLKSGLSNMRIVMSYYKRNAKKKGLKFELTEKQFTELTKQECYYCGVKPYRIQKLRKNGEYVYNGLDRIDNDKGYAINNVVSCYAKCNYAKRNMSLQEFKEWIERVYDKSILKEKFPKEFKL